MLTSLPSTGSVAMLSFGLVLGLRHATEVDHVVAVSTIVSEHRSARRSVLVGALWGAGHTFTLLTVGMFVVLFETAIPVMVAKWAELAVAIMIIGLGALAVTRTFGKLSDVHVHRHSHDGHSHSHIHFHENEKGKGQHLDLHSHTVLRLGLKPFVVGSMHGLAGSASLTMLILTQLESMWISLWYLLVFGFGSVCGMILMSGLIGVPFTFKGHRFTRMRFGFQATAGTLSILFGLWYALQITAH
jgi:ABC-type nickel/cobalt efflux system permease component RcnA